MNHLDLFSGLDGWGEPSRARGHTVISVDNDAKFNPTICTDILKLPIESLKQYGHFDLITASPPCTEFCKASLPKSWASIQRYGCNPNTDLLVKTLQIIQELKPDFWVIENVRGAIPYFKPFLGKPVKKVGSRYLWGKFPMFDAKPVFGKWKIPPRTDRAAIRSKIPYDLALNLCVACEPRITKCFANDEMRKK